MAELKFVTPSFNKLLERVEKVNLERAVLDAFNDMTEVVQPALEAEIKKHEQTGQTEGALVKQPEIQKDGNIFSIEYGYELKEGMAAIFLEYGTPRMEPEPTLRPAIHGNRHKLRRLQKEAVMKYLR